MASRAVALLLFFVRVLHDSIEAGDRVFAAVRESDDGKDDIVEHKESFANSDSGTEFVRARYLCT